jgi:D-glycero-alpha-D-manno-heptose 1-phosphate guanylyltransferase
MPKTHNPVPILLLAGGLGKRLRALEPNLPKPMVEVGGRPFLHWLIDYYVRLDFDDFIVSTGYRAEAIEMYAWARAFPGSRFRFHRETSPLGPGGAVQAIFKSYPEHDAAWVVNADTLLPSPLPEPRARFDAQYTVLEASEVFDATPNIEVLDSIVVGIPRPGSHTYFDAGAIYMSRRAVALYEGGIPCDVHALLAPAVARGKVSAMVLPGTCYDIGTPERYKRFEDYLKNQDAIS